MTDYDQDVADRFQSLESIEPPDFSSIAAPVANGAETGPGMAERTRTSATATIEMTALETAAAGAQGPRRWSLVGAAAALLLVAAAGGWWLSRPALVDTAATEIPISEQPYRWAATYPDLEVFLEGSVDPQQDWQRLRLVLDGEALEFINDGQTSGILYEGNGDLVALDAEQAERSAGTWYLAENSPGDVSENFLPFSAESLKTLELLEVEAWEDLGPNTVNGSEAQHLRTSETPDGPAHESLAALTDLFAVQWDGPLDVWVREDGAITRLALMNKRDADFVESVRVDFVDYGVPIDTSWPDGGPPTEPFPTAANDTGGATLDNDLDIAQFPEGSSSEPETRAAPIDGIPESAEPNPFDNRFGFDPIVHAVGQDQVVIINTQAAGDNMVAEVWDVRSNSLISTARSDFIWRVSPASTWTGSEIVIVGGSNGPGLDSVAVAFEPASSTWRALPEPPNRDPASRSFSGPGVWTGTSMVVHKAGLAVDPQTGTWETSTVHPSAEAPDDVSFWHESELFVLESCSADSDQFARCEGFADGGPFRRLDSSTGRWETLPTPPVPPVTSFAGAVFERELVVHAYSKLDGENTSTFLRFDLDNGQWSTVDAPKLVSPYLSISQTVNGIYFLVETTQGAALYQWPGSSLNEIKIAATLPLPRGNSIAVVGSSVVAAGPTLEKPLIVSIESSLD